MVSMCASIYDPTPKALHFKWHISCRCAICFYMWSPNKLIFSEAQPGAAFVATRWHELFDEFSPDTFHPKLHSISSLVSELTMIGNLHENHEAWMKHLKHVQSELFARLQGGLERAACSYRHLNMLVKMSKSDSAREVANLGRVLELEGFHSTMEDRIRDQFRELDLAEAGRSKEHTDQILTTLATFAFRKGCSMDDTENIGVILPRGGEHVRQWVLDALPTNSLEFDCIIGIGAASSALQNEVRKVTDNLGMSRVGKNFPGLPQDDVGVIYFRKSVSAFRFHEAIETLKTEVRASLNLLALYKQSAAPLIRTEAWRVTDQGAVSVPPCSPSLWNLHPRKNAVELANRAAACLAGHPHESAIRAALDLHNLAVSMADHRLRLVNLWSALECLASLVEGSTIISRIEKLVCPILTWRKANKLVRYLAISTYRWLEANPDIDPATLPAGLRHQKPVPAHRLLNMLTEAKDGPQIRALLATVSGHPLLLYRVNKGWELLHCPKKWHADLAKSSQWLAWHLWRIYRARNLLVHQGVEPECLPQLANHLQQYLSWTLSRLLHGLDFGDGWTGKDSWTFWRSKSEHLLSSLETNPEGLMLEDVFPESVPSESVYPVAR